jgi:hypothetical protein
MGQLCGNLKSIIYIIWCNTWDELWNHLSDQGNSSRYAWHFSADQEFLVLSYGLPVMADHFNIFCTQSVTDQIQFCSQLIKHFIDNYAICIHPPPHASCCHISLMKQLRPYISWPLLLAYKCKTQSLHLKDVIKTHPVYTKKSVSVCSSYICTPLHLFWPNLARWQGISMDRFWTVETCMDLKPSQFISYYLLWRKCTGIIASKTQRNINRITTTMGYGGTQTTFYCC